MDDAPDRRMGAALYEMTHSAGRGLRLLVLALVLGGLVGPIVAGLYHTVVAAFGGLPGRAGSGDWTQPWADLAALPGVASSVGFSLWTGLAATTLSLGLGFGLIALCYDHGGRGRWADRRAGRRRLRSCTPSAAWRRGPGSLCI